MQCVKNKGVNNGYLLKDENYRPQTNLPLKEHPNPSFQRESYVSLNGQWDFARTKEDYLPLSYRQKIRVPFAVETMDSLINRLVNPDDYRYYHKVIDLPENFTKDKIILHFEGVDQICSVFLNHHLVWTHEGGRTPFQVEVSPSSFPLDLVLRVKDRTDALYYTNGKQTLKPSGWRYSSSSGVYKPIWMENVSSFHLTDFSFTEDIEHHGVKVLVKANDKGTAKVLILNKEYEVEIGKETFLYLKEDLHLWSDKDPYLYSVKLTYRDDIVYSYFGLRKREIKEKDGYRRLYLNGHPVFLSGLLDQGYYGTSRLTPSSYQDYLDDILKTKEMGFNCLRVHRKTEIPYFYYLADRYGILLIQDFPCGGYRPKFLPTVLPRLFPSYSKEKHIHREKLGRKDDASLAVFEKERKEWIPFFHNHPSIIRETIFNEGWGEANPSYYYDLAKKLDSKRIFDTASGWYEANRSDVFSIHTYTIPNRKRKNTFHRLFILSEIGGIGLKEEGFPYPKRFGHSNAKNREDLKKKRTKLYLKDVLPQIKEQGLNGVIYTELGDCETEANGLWDYNRKHQKIDSETRKKLNQELYDEFASRE